MRALQVKILCFIPLTSPPIKRQASMETDRIIQNETMKPLQRLQEFAN